MSFPLFPHRRRALRERLASAGWCQRRIEQAISRRDALGSAHLLFPQDRLDTEFWNAVRDLRTDEGDETLP